MSAIQLTPETLTYSSIPDALIPYDWLERGFFCEPHLCRYNGEGIHRIKGWTPQNTVEGFKQELLRSVMARAFASSEKTLIVCRGLIGIDVDIKGGKQGAASWETLATKYSLTDLPLVIRTKSGGWHYYFRTPTGEEDVRSSVDWRDREGTVYSGIDIRSGNSVLAAPLSLEDTAQRLGHYYPTRVEISSVVELPELPMDMYTTMYRCSDNAYAKLENSDTMLDAITEGGRNVALYAETCRLVGNGYSESECLSLSREFAERFDPPLPAYEVENTIGSAWNAHAFKPKERTLRRLREQYGLYASMRNLDIIDLKGVPGSNQFDLQVFRKLYGNEFRLLPADVLSTEDLDVLTPKQRKVPVDMVTYAVDRGVLNKISKVGYRPGSPALVAEAPWIDEQAGRETRIMYNRYQPPRLDVPRATYEESAAVIDDWLRVVKHCCSDNDADTKLFLDWLAFGVQNPQTRICFAPYFVNVQGSGRGIVMKFIEHMVGVDNCTRASMEDITAKFNAITAYRRLVWVDEMHEYPSSAAAGAQFVSKFNGLITEDRNNVELKGRDTVVGENFALLILVSNHRTSLRIKSDDRRIMPFINFSKTYKPSPDVYARLYELSELTKSPSRESFFIVQKFVSHMFNFFNKRDITGFNHGGHAPMTSTASEIFEDSRSTLASLLAIDIANYRGVFRADVTTMEAVLAHCAIFHPSHKVATGNIKRMISDATVMSGEQLFSELRDPNNHMKRRHISHPAVMQGEFRSASSDPTLWLEKSLITSSPPVMLSVREHDKWRAATESTVLQNYLTVHGVTQNSERMLPNDADAMSEQLRTSVH